MCTIKAPKPLPKYLSTYFLGTHPRWSKTEVQPRMHESESEAELKLSSGKVRVGVDRLLRAVRVVSLYHRASFVWRRFVAKPLVLLASELDGFRISGVPECGCLHIESRAGELHEPYPAIVASASCIAQSPTCRCTIYWSIQSSITGSRQNSLQRVDVVGKQYSIRP